jgi:NIPSNAP
VNLQLEATHSPVVELRQYTHHPGRREALIELFEREFIETQEATGMKVIGQFRHFEHPNSFVWLRGFQDMPSRLRALTDFYDGPVWKAHRAAANATLVDSDNVLLLRPARPGSGFKLEQPRPNRGAALVPDTLVVATICYLKEPATPELLEVLERSLVPPLVLAGAQMLASFVTEDHPNTYPRLPVRGGEAVLVWFLGFTDLAAYERHLIALESSDPDFSTRLEPWEARPSETLRLSPTARSQLRG